MWRSALFFEAMRDWSNFAPQKTFGSETRWAIVRSSAYSGDTMMEAWQLTAIILGSLLVGAFLPLLAILTMTLLALRKQILSSGQRLDLVLDQTHETVARVNRLTTGLEGGEKQLADLKNTLGDLIETVGKFNSTLKMATALGAAIGPAVASFVQAIAARPDETPAASPEAAASQPGGD
jgi:hypothetical protein